MIGLVVAMNPQDRRSFQLIVWVFMSHDLPVLTVFRLQSVLFTATQGRKTLEAH